METSYKDFKDKLKNNNDGIYASLSHHQDHPTRISNFAVLKFKLNNSGNIYAETRDGRTIFVSEKMPAFEIYDGEVEGVI